MKARTRSMSSFRSMPATGMGAPTTTSIAVRGSAELLPRGLWQPGLGRDRVVVGAPIRLRAWTGTSSIERVRAFMEAQLGGRAGTAGPLGAAAR